MALRLALVVEGKADADALPVLLGLLVSQGAVGELALLRPVSADGRTRLTRPGGVERLVKAALVNQHGEPPDAVLVLLDRDEDACAVEVACTLRARIASALSAAAVRAPLALVVADPCYEGWLRAGHSHDPETDDEWDRSETTTSWLSENLVRGSYYRKRRDQPRLTSTMNLPLALSRSRSLRRLRSALRELVDACRQGQAPITPTRCPENLDPTPDQQA